LNKSGINVAVCGGGVLSFLKAESLKKATGRSMQSAGSAGSSKKSLSGLRGSCSAIALSPLSNVPETHKIPD
jgi:hypothetical protein